MRLFATIIIPTHNRARLLARAIDSIKQQQQNDIGIIVVSDYADSQAHQVASKLLGDQDIYVERHGLPGPAGSRNIGLSLARSDFTIFLDDDDTFSPGYFEYLKAHLAAAGDTVYYSDLLIINETRSDESIDTISQDEIRLGEISAKDLLVRNRIPNNCFVFPTHLIKELRYDPELILFEDWEFIVNLASKQDFPLSHLATLGPRVHKNDRVIGDRRGARNDDKLLESILYIYKKWPGIPEIKLLRQQYLQGVGITAPLEIL